MIVHFLQGAALALPATLTPGPLQAFLASIALRHGWRRTLPAALAPLLTDGPIVALVLLILVQTPPWLLSALRAAGGLFMLLLAWRLLRDSGELELATAPSTGIGRRSLGAAVIMNFLNPNPYIFWGVIAGPILLTAWEESAAEAAAFVVGFYGLFVVGLASLIVIFAMAGKLNPRLNRGLRILSALSLLGFGGYQLVTTVPELLGG